mmetsp:Transcript_8876/g.16754  ORF Transcript_8876/g.16754 Transcript_8876/m.16754 type:complete len:241 (-) Transcript_8876:281-1003(-)
MTQLPTLTNLDDEISMQKHFFSETANWVIPGFVLAGGNPVRASEGNVAKYLQNLVKRAKVTTYVCLQSEVEPIEGAENFGGIQEGNEAEEMPSYGKIAAQVDTVSDPKFVYCGIKDDELVSSMDELRSLIQNLVKRVQEDGEILYIHCKGGSGRTGIVVACLLGSLYPQISADEALLRTQKYFEMRAIGAGKWLNPRLKSPATENQMDQVREFFQTVVTEEMVEEGTSQRCENGGFCVIM